MMKNRSCQALYTFVTLLTFLLLISSSITSQIQEGGMPMLLHEDFPVKTITIQYEKSVKDFQGNNQFPLLIGHTQAVLIQPNEIENWHYLDAAQTKIWRIHLKFNSVSKHILYFSQFYPGENGRLFAFDKNRMKVIGAFTKRSKSLSNEFAFETMETSELIIQFETSSTSNDYQIIINEIGFIDTDEINTGFGSSGACEVNINCAEGDAWKYIKQGVARVLVKNGSSLFYCTGTLINNTLRNYSPYFLTANHCGEGASISDYNQWIFDFNYEGEFCPDPSTEPNKQSIVGASLKASGATYSGSDFKLLLLNQSVPADFMPFFNGWTRDESISQTGVGIHHPQGDIKKISTYTEIPISTDYDGNTANMAGKYWKTVWTETPGGYGVTEGGSSGSPLFNASGQIIGSLTGGKSDCSALNEADYYGKFSKSWTDNGSSEAFQLQPWLDPNNSGIGGLEGMGIDDSLLVADFTVDFNEININQHINFENIAFGRITKYEWFFEGAIPAVSNEPNPKNVTYSSFGDFDVKLIVSNNFTADTIEKHDFIRVKPFLYPNPCRGTVIINFGIEIPEEINIQLTDLTGRNVSFIEKTEGTKIILSIDPINTGLYILSVKTTDSEKNIKLLIIK
jgi:PKD repeat protein